MKLTKKAAYLRGLADGLGLAANTSEDKILRGVVELLEELSEKVDTMEDDMDTVSNELADFQADVYGDEEDDGEEDGEDSEDDSEGDGPNAGKTQYELTCPKCGAVTVVDEDTLMSQEIVCSNCGAPFDIEFGEDEDGSADKND